LVALIRHPRHGAVLWDTGYSPRLRAETAHLPAALYRYLLPVACRPEETAAAQLRRLGIAAHEVATVVISHLHADHIGGLRDFPAARIVLSRAALAEARRPGRRTESRPLRQGTWRQLRAGFLPGLLPADLGERARVVEAHPEVAVPTLGSGFDLFADGSVVAVPMPGHAPGQVGLLVRPHRQPETLLVADACWSSRALTHGELPHPIVALVTDDWRGYRRTVSTLAALSRARPDLLVVPSHCAQSIARAAARLDQAEPC
jgi:glyoxylase-like metal-dependent hydrolase (beta-lactamase superfamily II)